MTCHGQGHLEGDRRLDWYLDAKFGLFIHWGPYSLAGVEASWPIMAPVLAEAMFGSRSDITEVEYFGLADRFNPTGFDPDEWVRVAQNAGMRYVIFTTKHHDGFCMFDAPGTDYKITNTPYGRDICQELAQACDRAGMRLGFYYSPPDMHHPAYRDTSKAATSNWLGEHKRKQWADYLDYMESHVRKLLTDYGDVSVMWFDGLANHSKYDPARFHRLIHELSPATLINDRLGDGYDFITPEQFIPRDGIPARTGKPPSSNDPGSESFFKTVLTLYKIPGLRSYIRKQLQKYADGTLELTQVLQEPYPSPDRFQPWETCMTMGQTWAYNPDESDWKSSDQLVRNLVEVVSRGGNYLLNVGPTPLGEFPAQAVERLQYIGQWMDRNQEAVFGSSYTPLQELPWGQATRKGDRVYFHVADWPAQPRLQIDDYPAQAREVSLISGEALEFSQSGEALEIELPPERLVPGVSAVVVRNDSTETAWTAFSSAGCTTTPPGEYIRSQAVASGVINLVLNGLIALYSYRTRGWLPYGEVAVDVLITVAIIAFLVSWIAIALARGEIAKGSVLKLAANGPRLPRSSALGALIITVACVIVFGGVVLDGGLYLISPTGLSNWAYIVLKTLYTGVTAALAAALGIAGVLGEKDSA